jgi:hypothetical protein
MVPHSTDYNFMSALIDKIYFNIKIQMIFELAMKYVLLLNKSRTTFVELTT